MISNRDWYYLQQQRKRRREQGTPEKRYFYTNTGLSFINLDSRIELVGDFKITCHVSITDLDRINAFLGYGQTAFGEDANRGTLFIRADGGQSGITVAGAIPELEMSEVVFDVNSSGATVTVNGAALAVGNVTSSLSYIIENLFRGGVTEFVLQGILYDVEVEQQSTLIHKWAIDDNSGTVLDSVGGVNGTIVSPGDGNWELFTKVENTWVGETSGRVIPIAYA